MSITLDLGTKPAGLNIKTWGVGPLGNTVFLGDYEISIEDFLIAANYVLTNTDLEPNDPRLQFVKCVRLMKKVDSHNSDRKRLESSVPAVLLRLRK